MIWGSRGVATVRIFIFHPITRPHARSCGFAPSKQALQRMPACGKPPPRLFLLIIPSLSYLPRLLPPSAVPRALSWLWEDACPWETSPGPLPPFGYSPLSYSPDCSPLSDTHSGAHTRSTPPLLLSLFFFLCHERRLLQIKSGTWPMKFTT